MNVRRLPYLALPLCVALLSGCLSATPVAYTPHPEAVQQPLVLLRELAELRCAQGVEVTLLPGRVAFASACFTGPLGERKLQEIEFASLTNIRIVFGDWYGLEVERNGVHESGLFINTADEQVFQFDSAEQATRAADALWALKKAADAEAGR